MSIKFRSRVFRKPAHWTNDRYKEFLKEKGYFKTRRDAETGEVEK